MESMKQIKVCVFEIVSLKSLRTQLKSHETNQEPFHESKYWFSKVHFTSLKYYYTFAYPKIFDDSWELSFGYYVSILLKGLKNCQV